MKTTALLVAGLAISLLTSSGGAQQAPAPAPAAAPPSVVEIDSRFFTIAADAAERLGLTGDRDGSGPSPRSRFSKAEFEKLLGQLSAEKSMKLLTTPRVTTRSNQRAVIEIIREFRYPTEFEAMATDPRITPTKFETNTIGATLEVEPFVREGGFIELTVSPKLQAFLRFVGYAGGKTSEPEPIPRDGFNQPIFDYMWSNVGATLRSGQTLVIGGYEWHGPEVIVNNEILSPFSTKPDPGPAEERQLFFCTITAKLVKELDASERPATKVGGPVSIMPKLVSVSRNQLSQWIGTGLASPSGGRGTSGDVVDADHAEALRAAFGGVLGKAPFTAASSPSQSSLVAVIAPGKTEAFLKAVEAVSGSPALFGTVKDIALHEQYFAQARGILRYLPHAPGNAAPGQASASADSAAALLEQVDLQLAVTAHCGSRGDIDLDVISTLLTTPQASAGWPIYRRTGVVQGGWVMLDEPPRWTKWVPTNSVTIWSGSTVVFARSTEGQPDHLQILLITARGTPLREAETSATAPSPTAASDKANSTKLPLAIPVPGKPGFVTSPYAPQKGYVDIRGFPSGTEVKCPYSGKTFIVPDR